IIMVVKRDIGGAALLDACYRLDQPDEEWVRSLAESSRPLLDRGFGTMAYSYDLRDPHDTQMSPVAVAGGDPAWAAKPMQVLTEYGWDTLTFAYTRTPCVFSGRAVVAARCPPDDWKE